MPNASCNALQSTYFGREGRVRTGATRQPSGVTYAHSKPNLIDSYRSVKALTVGRFSVHASKTGDMPLFSQSYAARPE